MTSKDMTMDRSRICSCCGRKMHHGYKGVAIYNDRNKIKAYACSDTCSQMQTRFMQHGI